MTPAEGSAADAPGAPPPYRDEDGHQPEVIGVGVELGHPEQELPSLPSRLKTWLIGKPRDLADKTIFHSVSLVAFLAWVGLGADGLSSSCYGPDEAFRTLGSHGYLAVFLAAAIIGTVLVIATCYSHIIEEFPSGGGGYLVASKLMGSRVGVISGCALLVDYAMTIAVSVASAGDQFFSLLSSGWTAAHVLGVPLKLCAELAVIVTLIVLNLRGVKESILVLLPIFLIFLVAHVALIGGAILINAHQAGAVAHSVAAQVREGAADPSLGWLGMLMILLTAYSLGGGTYTGLEAVSNSMPVIREPRVQNAKRTMLYMAISLSFTAGGLILAYLLLNISPEPDKTMNYSLTRTFLAEIGLGATLAGGLLLAVTLLSESALLVVGAQAGFIDGPRVLGYMAHDSWMPRWFSNLSERLATQNGIVLMGISALAAVWFTRGDVNALVHIYSINVFITFSLSMIGMCRHWWQLRGRNPLWRRRLALFLVGAALCLAILCTTSALKFRQGGWIPLTITASLVGVAYAVRNYYRKVEGRLRVIDQTLRQLPITGQPTDAPPDPSQPTAVILVGGYSGLGIHTMLNVIRFAPNYFKNFVFISVGVVDTGNFKGSGAVDDLRLHTEETLRRYVELARRMGIPAASYMAIGTDAVDDLEQLCLAAAKDYPKSTVFAGQLVFEKDTWLHRLLHNQTAYSLQRRLQWIGLPMVILPTRVR